LKLLVFCYHLPVVCESISEQTQHFEHYAYTHFGRYTLREGN